MHKTGPVKLQVGDTMVERSLYMLPLPQFDAIIGMPFFRENEINLADLSFGSITINGSEISAENESDDDMDKSSRDN